MASSESDRDDRGPTLLHVTTVPETLQFLSGQIGHMKRVGFDVQALSSPGDYLEQFGRREGIAVHGVDMPRRITPLGDLRAVARIRRLLCRVRPTIIHGHTPKGGLLAMLGGWLARVPVRIYHIHGLPLMTARGGKRALLRLTERVSCALAHQVLCVSESVREVVVSEGLCPAEKIKVLGSGSINGVDAEGIFNPARLPADGRETVRRRYGIPHNAVVAGFVGRIVRDKGMVELAEAWRTLREELPDLHLLLVGPFEPQDAVPADVEALLRNDPRIHLLGLNWDTPPLYAAMDLVLLPTYREGFPVSPLEAAAMQLPIVATRVAGCVDAVVDGVTGTLVPARDARSLAEAIRSYVRDPDLRNRHGGAARQRVQRQFRPEALWQAQYQEYVRLLRSHGAARPVCDKPAPATGDNLRHALWLASMPTRLLPVTG